MMMMDDAIMVFSEERRIMKHIHLGHKPHLFTTLLAMLLKIAGAPVEYDYSKLKVSVTIYPRTVKAVLYYYYSLVQKKEVHGEK